MRVRIVAVPPGEAPEEIRKAWVGLELPLADDSPQPRTGKTVGVVSGPRGFFATLGALVSGKTKPVTGFRVPASAAIDVLAQHSPEAAAWWRAHTPQFTDPRRLFLFHESVCEIVE